MVLRIASLSELVDRGAIQLTRGKVISKKDLEASPGTNPVYSSAKDGDGKFGEYGQYMFDEELITWSVDGGGRLFHRHKHKFSVTNVGGILRILDAALLDYRYLYYLLTLRHSESRFDWVKKAHPSVIKKLYVNLPIPSLSEQKRIVAILDEAFEGIRIATANAEKNLANARELFENVRSRATAPRSAWLTSPINEVAKIQYGLSEAMNTEGLGYKIFRMGEVQGGKLIDTGSMKFANITSAEFEPYRLNPGDVLFNRTNSFELVGKTGILEVEGDYCFASYLLRVHFDEDRIDARFANYVMNSVEFLTAIRAKASKSINQANINATILGNHEISYPRDVSEQRAVADMLDQAAVTTAQLSEVYGEKASGLARLKQSILSRAFSGQLTATKGLAA